MPELTISLSDAEFKKLEERAAEQRRFAKEQAEVCILEALKIPLKAPAKEPAKPKAVSEKLVPASVTSNGA